MGGPDEIRTPPPPPRSMVGADAVPPAVTGNAMPFVPAAGPRADHYEWHSLGTSYLHGGNWADVAALFGDGARISTLETEITDLVARSHTATGPALGETMTRLSRCREVLDALHAADGLTIHRSDIDALRATAVDKILSGAGNPPNEANYQEGLRTLRTLQSYQALEARRDQLVAQVTSLYRQPQDGVVLFRLDYSGPEFANLDPFRYPTVQALNDQRVVQTYRTLANSSNPDDQRIAAAASDLFGHLRAGDGVFANAPGGTATLETVEAASRDLQTLFGNADLQTFFQRLGTSERDAMLANEGARVRLNATESLSMMQQFPVLINALTRYDALVAVTRPPEVQRTMLLDTDRVLVRRGECYLEFLRSQPQTGARDGEIANVQTDLAALHDLEASLGGTASIPVTREALTASARRMGEIATRFQALEERNLRNALTRMTGQLEQIPSPEQNIQPIRDALAAITDASPATPADRLTAYRRVAGMIDQAASVRLIDARIQMFQQQRRQVGVADTVAEAGLGYQAAQTSQAAPGMLLADYLFGGHTLQDNMELPERGRAEMRQSEANFDRMIQEYRALRTAVTSSDPATAARGRQDLQRLEGAAIQGTLSNTAEFAQTVNMITVGAGIILAASLTAGLGGAAIGAGAGALLSGTTIAVGTAEVIVAGVEFAASVTIFTAVQRGLESAVYGSDYNQHGFGTDLLINGLMFGAIGGAMRGVSRMISGYVERVAIANLERAGVSIVLREGEQTMSRFALETTSRAAVEREMARIMEGFTARLGTGAAILTTEYAVACLFSFAATAAELSARHDPNPVRHAADAIFSPKGQARMAAFILAMRVMSTAAEPLTAPIRQRLSNVLGERFLAMREAEYERNFAALEQQITDGRITDPVEIATRNRALLEQRQRIIIEARARETQPSELLEREFMGNEFLLRQLDSRVDAVRGMDRIYADGGSLGIGEFAPDQGIFTYRPGQGQAVVDAFSALPAGVDRARIRIHPNGMIEVPMLDVDMSLYRIRQRTDPNGPRFELSQTAEGRLEGRTLYFLPNTPGLRRPTGSALATRPVTAAP